MRKLVIVFPSNFARSLGRGREEDVDGDVTDDAFQGRSELAETLSGRHWFR